MIDRILTVGGLTLLSRVTGFAARHRDGGGAGRRTGRRRVPRRVPAAQSFPRDLRRGRIQRRLRAGLCAHPRAGRAPMRPRLFADRIFTLLLASQIVLLALALVFTPAVICAARAGLRRRSRRASRSPSSSRASRFPICCCVAGDALRRHPQFARHVSRPPRRRRSCSTSSMMATLALAAFFPTAGHAAAWGVLIAGVLEVLLVGGAALRADVMTALRRPKLDEDVKRFFKALGPATRRLRRRAARAVRRHHHRELPRRRRALGALLCRPALSASRSA